MKTKSFARSVFSACHFAVTAFLLGFCSYPAFPADATKPDASVERKKLEKNYPNWRLIVNTKEFKSWLSQQSRELQSLMDSERASDAVLLLDAYSSSKQRSSTARVEAISKGNSISPPQLVSNHNSSEQLDHKSDPNDLLPPIALISGAKQIRTEELFPLLSNSVAVVEADVMAGKSQGSGVVIGGTLVTFHDKLTTAALVATNAHVVRDREHVKVRLAGKEHLGTVTYVDPKVDIAIVRIEPTEGIRVVRIGKTSNVKVGSSTFAIGSPLGMENSLTTGIVSAVRKQSDVTFIQTSAPISPGSSGGGLFNDKGQLIGITTFKLRGGENINFAIDADTVFDIREAARIVRELNEMSRRVGDVSLSEIAKTGDLVRWLWKTKERGSGRKRYEQVSDLFYRFLEPGLQGSRGIPDDALHEARVLFSELKAEIAEFPQSTDNEYAGISEYHCDLLLDGKIKFRLYPVFDFQFQKVWLNKRIYDIEIRNNNIRFNDESSPPSVRWTLNMLSGSIEAHLINDFKALRAGEWMYRGVCKNVP